jgi:SHS2 domain-containing protein
MPTTRTPAGFEELPHTADIALLAWGPDNVSLFTQAALGLNAIAGVQTGSERVTRDIDLHQDDLPSLLVAFLSELVFLQENERLAFDKLDLQVTGTRVSGTLAGADILSLERPIKAVTFHNLRILSTERGFEVEVVFDV